jgi:hypothetical protein
LGITRGPTPTLEGCKGNRPECEYEDLFTAEQVRTLLAAERERCAQLCEQWDATHPARLADEIRRA